MATPTKSAHREIEPELLVALGRVVVSWSALEAILAEFLSFLLDANPAYMYVINQAASSEQQLKWIRTLTDLRVADEDIRQALTELYCRIDEARNDRNSLMHGVWSTDSEPGTALVQTIRLGRIEMAKLELVTRPDLDDLIHRIDEARLDLRAIGAQFGFLAAG